MRYVYLSILILCLLWVACCRSNPTIISRDHFDTLAFIKEQQIRARKFISSEKARGVALALFNDKKVIWQECFGSSSYGNKINAQTLFSLQSISKNITAFAVMIAVQEGLVNLDTPIIAYLPDFKINSCFDKNPADKIALRLMLTHTAGFTHEAPVGNNYDYHFQSYDEHCKSIYSTWLKFYPGTNYSYSNLGFDLAAQIIEKISSMAFPEFLKKKVFKPLMMESTTSDDKEVLSNMNRTEGMIRGVKERHYKIPLLGSGAVYSDLEDMIRYVQFLMSFGEVKGCHILCKNYFHEIYTIRSNNYGLGTYIGEGNNSFFLNHNGGGFGFGASIIWYPEYKTGCVILANKTGNWFSLASEILKDYFIQTKKLNNKDTLITDGFNPIRVQNQYNQNEGKFLKNLICSGDSIFKDEWSRYLGNYRVQYSGMEFKWYAKLAFKFGYGSNKIRIAKSINSLHMTGDFGESLLKEHIPGLFFMDDGEVLDFRNNYPTYKNLRLIKTK